MISALIFSFYYFIYILAGCQCEWGCFPIAQTESDNRAAGISTPITQPLAGSTPLPHRNSSRCSVPASSPGWRLSPGSAKPQHISRPPARLNLSLPSFRPPAYLLGQPFPFLPPAVQRRHLPQVLHRQLGPAVEEEPPG